MLRVLAKLSLSHVHISNLLVFQEKYKGNSIKIQKKALVPRKSFLILNVRTSPLLGYASAFYCSWSPQISSFALH